MQSMIQFVQHKVGNCAVQKMRTIPDINVTLFSNVASTDNHKILSELNWPSSSPPDPPCGLKIFENALAAGALLQTQLWELIALPKTPSSTGRRINLGKRVKHDFK